MDESMKKAIKFISDNLKDEPEKDRSELIEITAQKYDLNPMQQEFLIGKFVLNN